MFKNGLDADVEALRENKERELLLELGGEDMVDEERVGHPKTPKDTALATTASSSRERKIGTWSTTVAAECDLTSRGDIFEKTSRQLLNK